MQGCYPTYEHSNGSPRSRAWLVALLATLFFGPLLAPMFQVTHLPLVSDSGELARDLLSRYICPTPAKSFTLLGFPVAVCARCWGATIGLWAAWLLLRQRDTGPLRRSAGSGMRQRYAGYFALAWPLRLCLAAGALLLWTLEINAWPAAPLPVLLLNGANGGLWFGLFLERRSRIHE